MKETMTPRERVLKAINHQEPDRIPIDISAVDEVMNALIDYLELAPEASGSPGVKGDQTRTFMGADGTVFVNVQREAQLRLLERLHVDFRWAWATYVGPELKTYPDGSRDGLFGVRRAGYFFGYALNHPLANASSVKDIEAYDWDTYANVDHYDYDHFVEECEEFHEQGYAVYGGPWAPILFWACDLMGMDKFLMNMVDAPDVAHALIDRIAGFYYRQAEIMFQKARGKLDIFFMGDDYGVQNGLMISRQMWHEFIAPAIEPMWKLAKQYGLKIQLHSCGSVRRLIPDLIEMGLDVLDPIQVGAAEMDPVEIKREFGSRIALHGSMDTQKTLPFGTPEDVRNEVLHRIRNLAPGGGFILSPTQHLLTEIPLENIITMYDTAYEYGWY